MKAKELEVLAEAVRTENHRKRALETQKGCVVDDPVAMNCTYDVLTPEACRHLQLVMTSPRIFSNGTQKELIGIALQKR